MLPCCLALYLSALNFAYQALQGCDIMVYIDFSALDDVENVEEQTDRDGDAGVPSLESLLNSEESSEEEQKLAFICSCAIDSVKAGGSVLIPIGRVGVLLQLLEEISSSPEFSELNCCNGHTICCSCKRRVHNYQCPICRNELRNIRCLKTAATLLVPCLTVANWSMNLVAP